MGILAALDDYQWAKKLGLSNDPKNLFFIKTEAPIKGKFSNAYLPKKGNLGALLVRFDMTWKKSCNMSPKVLDCRVVAFERVDQFCRQSWNVLTQVERKFNH